MKYTELERGAQIMLYVIAILNELKDAGLLTGGMYEVGPEGKPLFEEMKLDADSGRWVPPSKVEINEVIDFLQRDARKQTAN